jgi:hypothetical protein
VKAREKERSCWCKTARFTARVWWIGITRA